jgi:hypothetical protein
MKQRIEEIKTFGDVRHLILQTVMDIRDGNLSVNQGMAIAANIKELNSNIQCEINAAKLSLMADTRAAQFGEIVAMGTKLIGENA